MKKLFILLTLLLPVFVSAQSTVTDKGVIYYTLGNDTTVIQYFEFGGGQYTTTFIQFTGAITKCEATGRLDTEGDIQSVSSINYRLDSTGNWELTSKGQNSFTSDSSVYVATGPKGNIINRRSFPGKGILANGMDIASFYVFPYMGYYAPANAGDTLFHRQLSFNGFRKYMVCRKGKKELRIGSNLMGYLTLLTDKKGNLQQIEGVGSSLNIRASVKRNNTGAAILDLIAKRRNTNSGTAVRTLRDTASLVLGNTTIEVDYWQPHKRGREIFGNVVPWNRVWRTGANNATQLRISNDIVIGGKQLAKGIYGIWSYPTENGWELIINKNANAWGTDHDAAADIFRVPLKVERADTPVEVLNISLTPASGKKAILQLSWDTYTASAEIITK